MAIGEICSREVCAVTREESLAKAALEMLKRHVGALVVVEARGSSFVPIGIVTDRDIVCGQIARRADLHCLTAGDVMTPDPLTIEDDCGIEEAIQRLSARGVRRAPVVGRHGGLVGLISLDDLFPAMAGELGALAGLIGTQARDEGSERARRT